MAAGFEDAVDFVDSLLPKKKDTPANVTNKIEAKTFPGDHGRHLTVATVPQVVVWEDDTDNDGEQ